MKEVANADGNEQLKEDRMFFEIVGVRDGGFEKCLVVVPVHLIDKGENLEGMCRRLLIMSVY